MGRARAVHAGHPERACAARRAQHRGTGRAERRGQPWRGRLPIRRSDGTRRRWSELRGARRLAVGARAGGGRLGRRHGGRGDRRRREPGGGGQQQRRGRSAGAQAAVRVDGGAAPALRDGGEHPWHRPRQAAGHLPADEVRGRGRADAAKHQVAPAKVPAADAEARQGGRVGRDVDGHAHPLGQLRIPRRPGRALDERRHWHGGGGGRRLSRGARESCGGAAAGGRARWER
mmetsp:Transcript_42835/g.138947  ORF Transcript_42835/g.138947 Transcript_42835/m.138947 type:complete len:231 (+) Transcript_42835:171-863(+)